MERYTHLRVVSVYRELLKTYNPGNIGLSQASQQIKGLLCQHKHIPHELMLLDKRRGGRVKLFPRRTQGAAAYLHEAHQILIQHTFYFLKGY